jgi:hypothetical protein
LFFVHKTGDSALIFPVIFSLIDSKKEGTGMPLFQGGQMYKNATRATSLIPQIMFNLSPKNGN